MQRSNHLTAIVFAEFAAQTVQYDTAVHVLCSDIEQYATEDYM
jgi:hypothetical protein